jgi:hypothetical protein
MLTLQVEQELLLQVRVLSGQLGPVSTNERSLNHLNNLTIIDYKVTIQDQEGKVLNMHILIKSWKSW